MRSTAFVLPATEEALARLDLTSRWLMRLDLPAFDSPATQMWGSELSSSSPCSSTAVLGQLRTWTSLRLLRTRNSLESGGGGLWVATALMSRGRRRAARAGRSSAERSGMDTASETA